MSIERVRAYFRALGREGDILEFPVSSATVELAAQAVGSGTLPVSATPAMTALMEKAAWTSLAPYLGEGESTVSTKLEITHDSASPLGIKVWAESEVTQVDGKRIVLKVAAYDEKGLIGQGVHERFIITNDRFLAKAGRKLEG